MSRVFVSVTVDDLDARDDPRRSDRVTGYDFTPDEIAQLLAMVKQVKRRVGMPATVAPDQCQRIN